MKGPTRRRVSTKESPWTVKFSRTGSVDVETGARHGMVFLECSHRTLKETSMFFFHIDGAINMYAIHASRTARREMRKLWKSYCDGEGAFHDDDWPMSVFRGFVKWVNRGAP